MPITNWFKSASLLLALMLSSWLITGCQAPQAPAPGSLPAPVIAMPEAVVPSPSPVAEPPDDVVLQPNAPLTSEPKPNETRELDRQIAQSYINSARQKKQNAAASQNSSVANALLKKGVAELRSNQTAAAKATLMQAQTLSPSNPAIYLYLSEVAIRESRPAEAQGLAQRGLLFSSSSKMTRGLWKMIQIAAQMQGNLPLANQAAIKANQS